MPGHPPPPISWRILLAALLVLALAHLFDPWAWQHLRYPEVIDRDSGRALRVLGYLPLWLVLAGALTWQGRGGVLGGGDPAPNPQNPAPYPHYPAPKARPWWRSPAILLAWGPMASGAATETIKILVRRERPGISDGLYVFRTFSDGLFHGSAFGLPSGHTGVAFGAATILARLAPRAAVAWYLLAAGTAWTRLAQGAHFLSDVVAGAVIGYLVSRMVWDRVIDVGTASG